MSKRSRLIAFQFVVAALLLGAAGCGSNKDELILPWVKYRVVSSWSGGGIWSGSSHSEVLTRHWWGWSRAFDEKITPARPIALTPTVVLVPIPGGARFLRESGGATPLACGDPQASGALPPTGGFLDCVDHLGGPAPAIAIALRVRRIDPMGNVVRQQEFSAGDEGRVFLTPSIAFYDGEGRPYLVTFRDPWLETLPDGTQTSGKTTPERLATITCQLIGVGPGAPAPVPAPAGHSVADCSTADVWSRVLGRPLQDSRKFQ